LIPSFNTALYQYCTYRPTSRGSTHFFILYEFAMPAKSSKEKLHPDLEEGEINDLSGAMKASKTQELHRGPGGDVRATSRGGDADVDATTRTCINGVEPELVTPGVEGASDQGREQEKDPPLPLAVVGVEAVAPCSRMGFFVIVFDG